MDSESNNPLDSIINSYNKDFSSGFFRIGDKEDFEKFAKIITTIRDNYIIAQIARFYDEKDMSERSIEEIFQLKKMISELESITRKFNWIKRIDKFLIIFTYPIIAPPYFFVFFTILLYFNIYSDFLDLFGLINFLSPRALFICLLVWITILSLVFCAKTIGRLLIKDLTCLPEEYSLRFDNQVGSTQINSQIHKSDTDIEDVLKELFPNDKSAK